MQRIAARSRRLSGATEHHTTANSGHLRHFQPLVANATKTKRSPCEWQRHLQATDLHEPPLSVV